VPHITVHSTCDSRIIGVSIRDAGRKASHTLGRYTGPAKKKRMRRVHHQLQIDEKSEVAEEKLLVISRVSVGSQSFERIKIYRIIYDLVPSRFPCVRIIF